MTTKSYRPHLGSACLKAVAAAKQMKLRGIGQLCLGSSASSNPVECFHVSL